MDWHQLKDWLERASGLDMDALHVYAGVCLQLLAALVLRRSLRSPIPWLIVLAVVGVNELYDYRYDVWAGEERLLQRAEGIKDVWNTMLLPTLLLIVARLRPRLLAGAPPSSPDPG
jgi:hypothetical protein